MSDHFSGPRAIAGPQCDICDFLAFPSPAQPGTLVLIMDVVPRADTSSSFSDAIVHRFRVRSVTTNDRDRTFAPGVKELVIDVTFESPTHEGPAQIGTCALAGGESVSFVTGDVHGGRGRGIRMFAGLRADPFFLDFEGMQRTLASGKVSFNDPGKLAAPGANTLGIVVEVGSQILRDAGVGPLVAAVSETVISGKMPIRLERVGRPEVKNFLMAMKEHDPINRNIDLRDLYNLEDPFHVGPDYRDAYRSRLDANLAYLDSLDGTIGWPLEADGSHPLTSLFLDDFLIVDLTKPHGTSTFLEIERSLLAGRPHETSGGRPVNDDVMDAMYTWIIGGPSGPAISDNVTGTLFPGTDSFPYLAEPSGMEVPTRPLGATSAADQTPAEPAHGEGHSDHEHHEFGHYKL